MLFQSPRPATWGFPYSRPGSHTLIEAYQTVTLEFKTKLAELDKAMESRAETPAESREALRRVYLRPVLPSSAPTS